MIFFIASILPLVFLCTSPVNAFVVGASALILLLSLLQCFIFYHCEFDHFPQRQEQTLSYCIKHSKPCLLQSFLANGFKPDEEKKEIKSALLNFSGDPLDLLLILINLEIFSFDLFEIKLNQEGLPRFFIASILEKSVSVSIKPRLEQIIIKPYVKKCLDNDISSNTLSAFKSDFPQHFKTMLAASQKKIAAYQEARTALLMENTPMPKALLNDVLLHYLSTPLNVSSNHPSNAGLSFTERNSSRLT